jgi:hypothetical protein
LRLSRKAKGGKGVSVRARHSCGPWSGIPQSAHVAKLQFANSCNLTKYIVDIISGFVILEDRDVVSTV